MLPLRWTHGDLKTVSPASTLLPQLSHFPVFVVVCFSSLPPFGSVATFFLS
jgi:hypothetical protein